MLQECSTEQLNMYMYRKRGGGGGGGGGGSLRLLGVFQYGTSSYSVSMHLFHKSKITFQFNL